MNIGQGRSREDYHLPTEHKYQVDLANYDTLKAYFVTKEYDYSCTVDYLVPPMRPFAVPEDSVYGGQVVFNGVECDRWTYTYDYETHHWITDYWVANTGNYYYPMKMQYSGNQRPITVIFTSFVPGPQEESTFEVNPNWNCNA
eukprot:Anaeramoba_ignava/c18740_g1_i2.p1 GENE.c18740_g1_i2~~c18740_g1_i2.p1  ORF type:complete len:143 (+),score=41.90 c18740_g1_i2:193-621(+)